MTAKIEWEDGDSISYGAATQDAAGRGWVVTRTKDGAWALVERRAVKDLDFDPTYTRGPRRLFWAGRHYPSREVAKACAGFMEARAS